MKNKIKELTKDTAIYGISTIVGRFLNFMLVPFYTNVLPKADFGIYSNVYAYIAFFNILYIYGMDAAYMKYASVSGTDEKKSVFSCSYLPVLITSAIFSVIFIAGGGTLSSLMEIGESHISLVYFAGAILFFDTLSLIPFAGLRLERKAGKFASFKIINILINIALNVILITGFNYGIEAILISNLAASAVTFLMLIPDIKKHLKWEIDISLLKKYLKFALPYIPSSLAATLVQVVDRPIVNYLSGFEVLGVYQANYKLGIFMMLIVSMFQFAWQPFFLNNAKDAEAKNIFSKVLTLFLIAGSLVWVILSLFLSDVAVFEISEGTALLLGKNYQEGLFIVPVILLSYLIYGMYINFTAGIYIEEKTAFMPAITGAGAASNVIANLLLIPLAGLMGAAIATLISYIVMSAGIYIVSNKYYPVKYEYSKIIRLFLLITATAGVYYYLHYTGGLTLGLKFVMFAVFIAMMPLMKIISPDEITGLKSIAAKLILRKK